ncbi:MAG: hypothetical protein LEGION0403_FIIPPAGN_00167 [Legionella sp.]
MGARKNGALHKVVAQYNALDRDIHKYGVRRNINLDAAVKAAVI